MAGAAQSTGRGLPGPWHKVVTVTEAVELHVPDPADAGRGRPWFVLPESPGGLGDPEVWIDEAALEHVLRVMYSGPAYIGATVRVGRKQAGRDDPRGVTYVVAVRRTGPGAVNLGRPYYVLQWPD